MNDCVECARLRRLLNLKDDAFGKVYGALLEQRLKMTPEEVHAVDLGFGLAEIEAAKARGENPYFKGTPESQLYAENARLSAERGMAIAGLNDWRNRMGQANARAERLAEPCKTLLEYEESTDGAAGVGNEELYWQAVKEARTALAAGEPAEKEEKS